MKHSKSRSSTLRKSLAIFLVVALVAVGVSAAALAATNQQPSTKQQIQPYSDQQQPSINQQQSMMPWGNRGQGMMNGMMGGAGMERGGVLMKLGMAAAFLFCLACDILLTIIVIRDAKKKGLSPVFWGILVFVTVALGLLIYLLYQQSKERSEALRPRPQPPLPGRVCPSCHTVQNPDNAYCYVCGAKLELRCKQCGAPLHPAAAFCPVCGTRATAAERAPEPVTVKELVTEAEEIEQPPEGTAQS